MELYRISRRAIWHGLILSSFSQSLYPNLNKATKITIKIIKLCITNLHELWLIGFNIVYLKMADSLEIEERVELIRNLKEIVNNEQREYLLPQYQSLSIA